MGEIPILTLMATLILMFLTLSTMFLLSVSSFDVALGEHLARIWRIISSLQAFIGCWSIILGVLWFLYIFLSDRANFINFHSNSQDFINCISLSTIVFLLVLSGFLGVFVAIYLHPSAVAVARTRREIV